MEHPNIAHGPPWKWWNGGPPTQVIRYDIKAVENTPPKYEYLIWSPILKETQDVKNQIDTIYSQGVWDDYKKITNPYEYVFLSLNRRMSRSVSARVPLSRSYFKMLELWSGGMLFEELKTLIEKNDGLITSHAAEGPGGFIEAIYDAVPKVKYTQAMTLRSTTRNIPGWRKTSIFLSKHPQINITYGADDTGDLLKLENLDNYIERMGEDKAHLYTADGGFDFSSDFNAQEETILPLLTAEFYVGMKSIQRGGILIVKIFDTTLRPTLELLWVVSRFFREWTIVKPRTSRAGNAERYIICKGYLGLDQESDNFFRTAITIMAEGKIIQSFLGNRLESTWIQTMLGLQEAIALQETDIIQKTLQLIDKPSVANIREYIEQNVDRSIQWCVEYDEPMNAKWKDAVWRQKTIEDEIKELTDGYENKNTIVGWRGLAEASQNDQPEPRRQQQMRHAGTFARTRPFQVGKGGSRARRAGIPDEEGWQIV